MEFAVDGGAGWRGQVAAWLDRHLGHEVLDPTRFEHDQLNEEQRRLLPQLKRAREFDAIRKLAIKIVRYDVALLLEHSDYVICHWNEDTQLGCGTAGELTIAAMHGKPVHLMLEYPPSRASTWMIGCTTTIHDNWEDLLEAVRKLHGGQS
jgi:nucleoside 2-deoxyribosyltransferase